MSARKINAWHQAGLIDAETCARLIAHEAASARPLALWGAFGIGGLTIGLGLISVVAANWEAIPVMVRLSAHIGLVAAVLGLIAARHKQLAAASPWALETLTFVAGMLGLTFFGHLGQAYQTSSPLWQPLAMWLLLFGPLLLLTGRGWLSAALIVGGAVWCALDYVAVSIEGTLRSEVPVSTAVGLALVSALPLVFAPLGGALRARSTRPLFWQRTEQLALAYPVAGASLVCVLAGYASAADANDPALGSVAAAVRAGLALAAGLACARARPGISGQMVGAILAASGAAALAALAILGSVAAAGALFIALWAGIAAAALAAQWRGVFQLAVAVIALRLIVLSFELAGDLLASGFGLILAGLLILGVAWGALQISRRLAPPGEGRAA